MTVRQYFEQYVDLCKYIKLLEEKIAKVKSQAVSVGSFAAGAPSGRQVSDKVGRSIEMIDELERKYTDEYERMLQMENKIRTAVESLESIRLRRLMTLRYLDGLSVSAVSDKMRYSERQVKRLTKKAVYEIERKMSLNVTTDV